MDLRQLLGSGRIAVGGRPHRTPPYFQTKKVAILGCTANVVYAPWQDPSWTLVSHCSARGYCKREPDWYFDLHRPACFTTERKSWNPQYHSWLKQLQTPIFMQEESKAPWSKIPMAVRYPIERITAEYASSATGRLYATNHAAYMIALAMTEGVTHIGLFGCQYSQDTDYAVQRDSLSYWLGRFEQSGGRVVVPPKFNTLLSFPKGLYGYESHDDEGKLTLEYRGGSPSKVLKAAQTPDAPPPEIDPETGLAKHPFGEAPAFDRRALMYRDAGVGIDG